jgi:hypothetical protein
METEKNYVPIVGEYWNAIGKNWDGLTPHAWSAAFISFCVKKTGIIASEFPSSGYHSEYCAKIYSNQYPAFSLLDPQTSPVLLGDIICQRRENDDNKLTPPLNYNSAIDLFNKILINSNYNFESHGDIVVEIHNSVITAIGGNVSDAVASSSYSLDVDNRLDTAIIPFICIVRKNI